MIQFNESKPCADDPDSIQVEGTISLDPFDLAMMESKMLKMHFKVFTLGNPKVLICKREDCFMMVHCDGSFTLSQIASKEKLLSLIQELEEELK